MTPPRRAPARFTCPLFAALLAVVAGCGREAPPPPAPPPAGVTVARPVPYPVQAYHEYNGYLDSVETVQIRARVKGILTEVKFSQQEGTDVKEGDDLYAIDPREYDSAVKRADADIKRAEADIAKADADISAAEAQYRSASGTAARLKGAGVSASGDELDKAVAAATSAEANKKVAEASKKIAEANRTSGLAARETASLNVEYTRIKAPISGRISRTLVTKGNLVGQTDATLLTTIVRMDKLYVYFDAPERDLVEQLKSAAVSSQPATLPVELGVATEAGYPHAGVIDFRENRVDQGTGTIRVRGRLDNPPGADGKERRLYPGLFARVRVPVGPRRELPVIPEEALMTGQEGSYVYVVGDDVDPKTNEARKNVVKKRSVSVAPGPPVWRKPAPDAAAGPGWTMANPKAPAPFPVRSVVAIEKGLEPTDLVIVVGLQKARPGAPVAPEEWPLRGPAAAPASR